MNEQNHTIHHISPAEFSALDWSAVTLLDVRSDEQALLAPYPATLRIPRPELEARLAEVPADRPVYVVCRRGNWSLEAAALLAQQGVEVYNVDGGYEAYEAYVETADPIFVDARGLKCPGPIVQVADTMRALKPGQRVYVEATEDAFASDIAVWCDRTGNRLQRLEVKPDVIEAVIQRRETPKTAAAELPNDKTFVVFSGDLDKTIAAFIMANGAAAMGRRVTLFFTFWGLNILRRPKRVRVKKNFIERMFGFMMPRGTLKLGLSRMNMGGLGAKMIRWIMKSKNVRSLEQLMQDALDHGVRLVACQMSMDIMGIKKEELIDGVELGGVSTFLGSGEQSDMSLFI